MEPPIGIRVIDDAVPGCAEVIEVLRGFEWTPSVIIRDATPGVPQVGEERSSSSTGYPMLSWSNPPVLHEANRQVYLALDQYAKDWNCQFLDIEPVSVQRYLPGQEYRVHTDHHATMPRIISAVLYLNTVEGGETHFPHLDFSVSPQEGRLVIFPANFVYAHAALPPTAGTKYAAAYWALG